MAMTLRFPDDDERRDLEAVAKADGLSMSEAVHNAIREHIAARRADPEFQARLRRLLAEEADVLKRLAQ